MKPSEVHVERSSFGPASPALGWVPAPRYLLRRDRILNAIRDLPPGRLLEVGIGSGALLCEISHLGFDCTGLESSPEALALAGQLAAGMGAVIELTGEPGWQRPFDYVASFEVLEHIEKDEAALREWVSWLKDDGVLLLSVPAREKLWSASDEWAGHFRRYEKERLRELIERVGLRVRRFECYGFPLSNCIEPLRASLHAKSMRTANVEDDRQTNTARSGTDRAAVLKFYRLYSRFPGAVGMWACCRLQRAFLHTDWGTGYLITASR